MVKRFPTMDAWMREGEEALRLIDDIECRVKNNYPNHEHICSLRDAAKSKLLELGIKLDRLESLLRNPPSKPILTDADIDLRWKMLVGIQQRTRVVALSTLFAAPPRNRPDDATELKDDMELAKPLILLDDTTQNSTRNTRLGSFITESCMRKAFWAICMIFGAFALLSTLFFLCTLI